MGTFLTAEWRNLVMANYKIDPKALVSYLPAHTELDLFEGDSYVSLVGFLFQNTKIKSIGFPFHRTFEEINLRFYVRHKVDGQWRRGVVFVKEIVPKVIITLIANGLYDENYVTLPTQHVWQEKDDTLFVQYKWKYRTWNSIEVLAEKQNISPMEGSQEEFITEHYWGYAQNKRGFTTEYGVEHPKWRIHPVLDHKIACDFLALYGDLLANAMEPGPSSIFLAEGSKIKVMEGRRCDD
jgi:uncharacterized protein YqjF (DUF2071 family)